MHELFHPAVSRYFQRVYGTPTPVQLKAWQALHGQSGLNHALISAPTGEGKTLAAFLAIIDRLVWCASRGEDIAQPRVLYISPLKALANDIEKNLQQPLAGIRTELAGQGTEIAEIRAMVRTGDSSQSERARLVRLRPQIIVTTPESFYLLLTSPSGRNLLATIETVIIDEIHALVGERRGAHLALSLARLEALRRDHRANCPPLQRIGVSATVRPLKRVAQYLAGDEQVTYCLDERPRPFDIRMLLPDEGLSAVMSGDHWNEIYRKLTEEISIRRTTLVFVNNRRLCERMARSLSERLGADCVAAHHGSLSYAERRRGEERLKASELKVMVATQSLELGLDIGSIDLVVQVSSPRSIHAFIQRAGRSEHHKHGTSRVMLVPLTRDDLRECVALVAALRRGELEEVKLCAPALDVLAQQVVAEVSARDYAVDELFALFTGSFVYHDLQRSKFLQILQMLNDGFSLRFGRRSRYLFFDQTAGTLHARPGARLIASLNGGAIPENFEYEVVDETDQVYVGSVHEDFAIESMRGDVFQLGNRLWQIVRVSGNRVSVVAAPGKHPTMPFWIVDVPGRSDALSGAVARLNESFLAAENTEQFVATVAKETGLEKRPLVLLADYLLQAKNALGTLPTQHQVILERFFDEVRNCHIVLHFPFGAQVNRAWGFALRKRFCRKFNFELQAAATDDAIILSLSHTHSFPLAEVFSYLSSRSARDVLTQALLDAPVFEVRWRWNASRALAILRRSSRGKTPAQWQKSNAQDLIALLFPDQIACAENLSGPREVPDHPLVEQTLWDCLNEAMDVQRLLQLLTRIEGHQLKTLTIESNEPSALAHEIINARPYAFLDDAALEERRTRAVRTDRQADEPASISDDALAAVQAETLYPARSVHELYDLITQLSIVSVTDLGRLGFASGVELLRSQGKIVSSPPRPLSPLNGEGGGRPVSPARILPLAPPLHHVERGLGGEEEYFTSADKAELVQLAFFAESGGDEVSLRRGAEARASIILAHLELLGPMVVDALAQSLPCERAAIEAALAQLETDGSVFRLERSGDTLFVERAYYQRLRHFHRRPVRDFVRISPARYLDFLLHWQRATEETRLQSAQALPQVLRQLTGVALSCREWSNALRRRIADFQEKMLEELLLTGDFFWYHPARAGTKARNITPQTRFMLLPRDFWRDVATHELAPDPAELGADARRMYDYLERYGASFLTDIHSSGKFFTEQTTRALRELIARGMVTSDQLFSLERLFARRARPGMPMSFPAGRFALIRVPEAIDETRRRRAIAEMLLRRQGVLYRYAAELDFFRVPWPDLVRELRLMEMAGLIRSGRYIDLLWGEQFVEPQALPLLAAVPAEAYKDDIPRDPVGIAHRLLARLGVMARVTTRFAPTRFLDRSASLRYI